MSDIERLIVTYAPGIGEVVLPSPDGRFVRHEDHFYHVQKLKEEVATLKSVCRQAAWLAKPISKIVEDRLLIARVDKLVADLEQAGREATSE